jgi:sporulation protein YlmC with PRC-barrel domain
MIKNHIAACLMATALVAAPAMAQTTQPATPPAAGDTTQPLQTQPGMTQPGTTQPGTTQDAPAADTAQQPTDTMPTDAPATGTATTDTAPADTTTTDLAIQDPPGHDLRLEGNFIAQQSPNHTLANDLIGVNVIGADDSSIGAVKDLVMDGENRLVGIVVGVGGFLGIGEKSVAIPMDAANIVPEVDATAATGAGAETAREIEEIRVSMTREQLDEAPEFARLERPAPAMDAPAPGGMAPGGMAPGGAPGAAPGGMEPAPGTAPQPN